MKNEVKQGEESVAFKVNPSYELKKLVLVYKTLENPKKAKAKVELYGLR